MIGVAQALACVGFGVLVLGCMAVFIFMGGKA